MVEGAIVRRRDFIALVGGTAVGSGSLAPFTARAQQSERPPTIGFLGGEPTVWAPWTAAFVARLRELGWIEGRTVVIEYRWAEGHIERNVEIAAEFVRRKVDVIVTFGTAVPMMKQATSVIPIVFAIAQDPIGVGLVSNLSRPGGNVTGLSIQSTEAAGKRVEILRELVPRLRHLAIMADFTTPGSVLEMGEVQAAARPLGIEVAPLPIQRAEDIGPAFATLKGRVEALYVVNNALVNANRARIVALALAARLPTIFNTREAAEAGGLLSYGPSYPAQFRRVAELVDRILRGTKPGDVPVEQPTKFDLVVNLKTANALGLTIPEAFLTRADVVIE
jgi:putative ABC transport system substrate-binding protein